MKLLYNKEVYLFDSEAYKHIPELDTKLTKDNVRDYLIVSEPRENTIIFIYYHNNIDLKRVSQFKAQFKNIIELNKPNKSFGSETIIVANTHWYKPEPNDLVVYIGRGRLPDIAHINGNCGNPFTVEQYGREIALQKYIESNPNLDVLTETVKPYFGKQRIVLLCWCKPNNCHGDYIKQHLLEKLL